MASVHLDAASCTNLLAKKGVAVDTLQMIFETLAPRNDIGQPVGNRMLMA
jgi:hypothetical protein